VSNEKLQIKENAVRCH